MNSTMYTNLQVRSPNGHQTVNGLGSGDSFSSGGDRPDSRRSPPGVLTIAAGTSAKNLVIWGENRPVAEQSPGGNHHVTTGLFKTLFKVKKIGRRATDLEKSEFGKNRTVAVGIEFYWDVGLTFDDVTSSIDPTHL